MQKQFNIYDLLAYIIPGGALLLVVATGTNLLFGVSFQQKLPSEPIAYTFVVILLSYLTGHILQSLIRPLFSKKDTFLQLVNEDKAPFDKKNLKKLFSDTLKLEVDDNPDGWQSAFNCAYALLTQKDLLGNALVFNSLYGFYRALTVILAVAFLFVELYLAWKLQSILALIPLVPLMWLVFPPKRRDPVRTRNILIHMALVLFLLVVLGLVSFHEGYITLAAYMLVFSTEATYKQYQSFATSFSSSVIQGLFVYGSDSSTKKSN